MNRRLILTLPVALLAAALNSVAAAQQQAPLVLSLPDALDLARRSSETVELARAGLRRSEGQFYQARSGYFPQLTGSASYTRTLASQFSSLQSDSPDTTGAPTSCERFRADPTMPIGARVDSLESAVECLSSANPFAAFSDLPFGRENQYSFGLQLSQNLFTGGRLSGQNRAARATRLASEIGVTAAEASLTLDVTQAYFDAVLSDRLLTIAQASLRQADSTYEQVKLGEEVGTQAEFDLLRAQVARDNQRPVVIQRAAARDIAYLRLRQLLNLPADRPVELTSGLDDSTAAPIPGVPMELEGADTSLDRRAPVRQAEAAVAAQDGLLKAARAQHFPSLTLTSQYAQLAYPSSAFPGADDFVTDWTVGVALQLPIFTGGRIRGDVMVARANLDEARQRLSLTRKAARLDAFATSSDLAAARAIWEASRGTVEQARRAWTIAQIRYREGISTQLELNDARLQLQQAEANRAQATRDLQVARVRAALLPDLPLTSGDATGGQAAMSTTTSSPAAAPAASVTTTGIPTR